MPQLYQCAHIQHQGQDMIIVLVRPSFQYLSGQQQNELIQHLQVHANRAGLAGTVVPAWNSARGFGCICPTPWKPFFKSITWKFIVKNVNKRFWA